MISTRLSAIYKYENANRSTKQSNKSCCLHQGMVIQGITLFTDSFRVAVLIMWYFTDIRCIDCHSRTSVSGILLSLNKRAYFSQNSNESI